MPDNDRLQLAVHGWQAEFSAVGGQLIRLRHVLAGKHELLRTPPTAEALASQPELWGFPVLFPPNRIAGGKFDFQGRRYVLPLNEPSRGNHIHGILLRKTWRMVQLDATTVALSYEHLAEDGWPHDFSVELRYGFAEDSLLQSCLIANASADAMPFLLGFHSAFQTAPDMSVRVTASTSPWRLDEGRKLPDGSRCQGRQDWRMAQRIGDLGPVSQLLSQTQEAGWCGMELSAPSEGYRLRYEVDAQFRFWMLWNGTGQGDFFCAEPMTCLVNAPNLSLPAQESGMDYLRSGERRRLTTCVRVTAACPSDAQGWRP